MVETHEEIAQSAQVMATEERGLAHPNVRARRGVRPEGTVGRQGANDVKRLERKPRYQAAVVG